jgi:hypothetical protein
LLDLRQFAWIGWSEGSLRRLRLFQFKRSNQDQTVKIRSGYCIQFLLLALLAGAGGAQGQSLTNSGPTTGLAWVFANGVVPVEWPGQPGLHLQTATDGTNWTSGVETTNGLMSVTHWPVSGTATFFRLVGE